MKVINHFIISYIQYGTQELIISQCGCCSFCQYEHHEAAYYCHDTGEPNVVVLGSNLCSETYPEILYFPQLLPAYIGITSQIRPRHWTLYNLRGS
jgi:hypothetical protein